MQRLWSSRPQRNRQEWRKRPRYVSFAVVGLSQKRLGRTHQLSAERSIFQKPCHTTNEVSSRISHEEMRTVNKASPLHPNRRTNHGNTGLQGVDSFQFDSRSSKNRIYKHGGALIKVGEVLWISAESNVGIPPDHFV